VRSVKRSHLAEKIRQMLENVKGCKTADDYYYGFKDACETLLDWLVKEGVIENE
jgi:CRISPR/Cas system-associated protein Csm6